MAESKTGVNLQLPNDLYNDLKAICEYRKVSMTAAITEMIQSYLAENAPIVDALKKQRELFDAAMAKVESAQAAKEKAKETRRNKKQVDSPATLETNSATQKSSKKTPNEKREQVELEPFDGGTPSSKI